MEPLHAQRLHAPLILVDTQGLNGSLYSYFYGLIIYYMGTGSLTDDAAQ